MPMELLEKMTVNPAKLYHLPQGRLQEGRPADLVIFDPEEEWTVKEYRSKAANSPFTGWKLKGKVKYTICDGKIVERLLCKDIDGKKVNRLDDLTFYKKQKRIALKNCGVINPEDIDEYIAFDGYRALARVLIEMNSDEVIETIEKNSQIDYIILSAILEGKYEIYTFVKKIKMINPKMIIARIIPKLSATSCCEFFHMFPVQS